MNTKKNEISNWLAFRVNTASVSLNRNTIETLALQLNINFQNINAKKNNMKNQMGALRTCEEC